MHEMGVALNIVERVEFHARRAGAKRVAYVTLRVGDVSGIETRYLDTCWEHAAEGTLLEGSHLEYEMVKGILVCSECGKEYDAYEAIQTPVIECPYCRSQRYAVKCGKEFDIVNIAVED